jgi:hypothetical protein
MYGTDLMESTGGDLAGWLGELAPRGDLSSSQLLYRMCCFWERLTVIDQIPLGPNTGAWKAAKAAHHFLLSLLVLAYQIPELPPEVTGSGGKAHQQQQQQQQQQQGSQQSAVSSRALSAAAAAAKRAQQARDALRTAVMSSPMCLSAVCISCQTVPGMMQSVFEKVEQRVSCEGDQAGWIFERTRSWIANGGLDNNSLAAIVQEPLTKIRTDQEAVWSAAWEHNYSAKEEAQHIKRLQACVQAATDRAAEQLQEHPELVESLMEALES